MVSQWMTRYVLVAEGCRCGVVENEFQFDLQFERANGAEKEQLLPFLAIDKALHMTARIKHLNIVAPAPAYHLLNKCFMFNLSHDDQADPLFIANHSHLQL